MRKPCPDDATPDAHWWACVIASGLSVAALAARHAVFAPSGYIEADGLWPIMFLTDLLGPSRDFFWSITAANGFFPDLLLIAALKVAGVPDTVNFIGYFLVLALALWSGLLVLLLSAGCGRGPALVAAWVVAGPGLSLCGYEAYLSFDLLSPDFHQGSLVVELFALAAILRARRFSAADPVRLRYELASIALIALGTFSDRIIIAHLVLPLGLVLVQDARADGREALARGLLPPALGVGIGLAGFWLLRQCPMLFVQGIELSSPVEAIGWFLRGLALPVAGWPRGLAAFGSLLLLLAVVRVSGPRRELFFSFTVVAAIICFLAPLLLGLWNDGQPVRYQVPFYLLLPAAGIAWCLRWLAMGRTSIRQHRWFKRGFLGVVIVAGVQSSALLPGSGKSDGMFARHEALAAALSAEGYNDVFAEYWDAKPLLFASAGRSRVCQLFVNGLFSRWESNDAWCVQVYADLAKGPDLVPVVGRRTDWAALRQNWGEPIERREIAGFDVWFYPRLKARERLSELVCEVGASTLMQVAAALCPRR